MCANCVTVVWHLPGPLKPALIGQPRGHINHTFDFLKLVNPTETRFTRSIKDSEVFPTAWGDLPPSI